MCRPRPEPPATQELLCAELERRGWASEVSAEVRIGALAPVADVAAPAAGSVRLTRVPDEEWLGRYGKVNDPDVARRLLVEGPSVWFASLSGGRAVGRCVVDGRWAWPAVTVDPVQRREGLATAVMAALARKALEEGASAAWLQVETDNAGALALYDGLGFATHHTYHHYRAAR